MAIYRLTSARLLVQTFGDSFVPTFRQVPQVLAQSINNFVSIRDGLQEVQTTWESTDLPNAEEALKEAMEAIRDELTTAGNEYTLEPGQTQFVYQPIYDKNGIPVAHDVIGWLYYNGAPVITVSTSPEFMGLVANIYLAAAPV